MNSESIRYILVRLIKILLILFGIVFLFLIGTFIGYCVFGDGSILEVFTGEIWQHIFSFLQ